MRSFQLALAAVLILAPLAGCIEEGHQGHDFAGMEYDPAAPASDFHLTDQHGAEVALHDFEGKFVVVTFGYTHCPDVCNIVSANLKWTHGELGELYGQDVEFLTITIDPARDTVEHLANHTERLGYEWQFLTSEHHMDLHAVWDDWNLVVDNEHINSNHSDHGDDHEEGHDDHEEGQHNDTAADDESEESGHDDHDGHDEEGHDEETVNNETQYEVGHNTVTFVLDEHGNKRLVFVGSSWEAADLLEDLHALIDGASGEGHEGHNH